jgi:hypothetical protein
LLSYIAGLAAYPSLVIRVLVIDADATDEIRIKYKITGAEAKANEHNCRFLLT